MTSRPSHRRWLATGKRLLGQRRFSTLALALLATVPLGTGRFTAVSSDPLLLDPGLSASISAPARERSSNDPLQFSASELQELQRRFGVHGPQPRLAQLFTHGIDQLEPLRNHTLGRISDLRPLILAESQRQGVNPLLVAAVLFDEMRHAKPGEDLPLAAHSGLFSTHGPAQLGLGEMVHQGLLRPKASDQEITQAREQLLDPERNVVLLVGKFARLSRELNLPSRPLQASVSQRDAKALATLAYLHNGKLDYPRRILRTMQDPELHALLYSKRKQAPSPLI
ncbi:helicase DnaB [Cyanobium sp. T1B-Tous]|uniref:helicase DnaB n=1 Tax=Cyanobium sp. T1B-Tous TaxID=2823721 RepID=UPI0037BF28DB